MTLLALDSTAAEIFATQQQIEELTAKLDRLKDVLKSAMVDAGDDTISGTGWKATWKTVTSNKLDQKALKAGDPDLYARYCKPSTVCRFCIN